tara:strand:- start:6783 stop:7427 length:645 start_codon:yes stop_codon:yes gene_type:complete
LKTKFQILTSKNSWFFLNYKKNILKKYKKYFTNKIITTHTQIKKNNDIVVIVSYYKIIPSKYLKKSKHNLVVHESNLPQGRGFSPLYRQILNGKTNIVFSLFECSEKTDKGKIYFKKKIKFPSTLIFEEIKIRQMNSAFSLIEKFFENYSSKKNIKSYTQRGKVSYFKKIKPDMSKLDINKSIKSQFDIIRTRDNENFPSFFVYKKRKFVIKIY